MKILLTSGATREPIDGVRFLTNFASGKTGSVLADYFAQQGVQVVYLHGVGAKLPKVCSQSVEFSSFADLDNKMHTFLASGDFDAVVHLAAVGDFALERIELDDGSFVSPDLGGKLDSSQKIKLQMKKTHKILPLLKSYAGKRKPPFVVGFKLTNSATQEQITQKMAKIWQAGGVDLVVHNDKNKITDTLHPATFYKVGNQRLAQTATKEELAKKMLEIMKGELER